ncbi:MAG: efflux RND transporter periplasmic adaptor subunit [Rhizobiaceae bacterium]|nr:efflux RND transporter periplasmic adaptor subunit [Rhizobiaceae bacterium]
MSISQKSVFHLMVPLLLSVLLTGCNNGDDQANGEKEVIRPVKIITVEPTAMTLERKYSVVVLPSQEADLSFRVSGRIVELPIRNGINVKQGDVIAQLDTRDFKATITQMESQLAQAQEKMTELKSGARDEDLAALEADVAAAQAQVDSEKFQVERTQELFKKGIVAKSKVDQDVTARRVADATLEAKRQALIKGRAGARSEDIAAHAAVIRGVESQLSSAKDNLSDATLRAPFDGVIASRTVENFTNIQAKEKIAVLQNLKILDATFDVPSPDVAKLVRVKSFDLKVVFESIPGKEFGAIRNEFSTQADPATQTFRGRVTIEDLNGEIVLPGMTGDIFIKAKQSHGGAIYLPLTAIASSADGKPFAWIVDPGSNKVSKQKLVTGDAIGATILVTSGVKTGDLVVTAGLSALQDGMAVKPITVVGE